MRLMFNWCTGLLPNATATPSMDQWVAGVAVPKGAQRRYTVSGLPRGYQAYWSIPAGFNTVTPNNAPLLWRDLGYIGATTFKTDAPLSDFPDWSTGAVAAGTIMYDKFARRDYYCNQALTSPQNVLSPSQCAYSAIAEVRGYWRDMGVANAFRMFDGETYTRTRRVGSSMYCEFGFNQDNSARSRAVYVFGMQNISSVRLRVYNSGGTAVEDQTKSALYSKFYGEPRLNALSLAFDTTTLIDATYTFRLDFTKKSGASTSVEVGMIAVGEAFDLGPTRQGLRLRHLNFSRQQRDETFGLVSFLRRGVAKVISATVLCNNPDSDTILRGINAYRGGALVWDFNNADTAFDHLRAWGFSRDHEYPYRGLADGPGEIQFEVEGLVEEG
jgi:hypothetical protein